MLTVIGVSGTGHGSVPGSGPVLNGYQIWYGAALLPLVTGAALMGDRLRWRAVSGPAGGGRFSRHTSDYYGNHRPIRFKAVTVTRSLTGTATPAGTLQKTVQKPLSSSVTPAGSLAKRILRVLTGTVTPAGTLQKTVVKQTFTSSVTPASAHVIQKVITKVLTSTITAAGTLQKTVLKPLASSIGLTGLLSKLVQKQTLTSTITPAGTVQKTVLKQVFASTVTAAGSLQRTVLKPFASSVGLTGTLTRLASLFRTFTSSVTPSGTLQKTTQKPLTSSIGLSGTLARLVQHFRSSSVTPAGSLQKTAQKPLSSTIAPAGVLQRFLIKPFASTINLSGVRTFLVRKTMTSTISPTGMITKQVQISRTSTIGLAGTLAKQAAKSFSSSIGVSAVFTFVAQRTISTRRFTVNALARIRTVWARVKAVADPLPLRTVAPAPRRIVVAATRTRTVHPLEDSMAELPTFSSKRVDEIDAFTFDFVNQLGVGETLSAPIVMEIIVSTESTVPDAGPALTVSGAAAISGTKVVQKLQAGLNGALYIVTARVNTSTGRTIECAARLPVKDETA